MASLAMPLLPRKIDESNIDQLSTAHVNAHCAGIWNAGRHAGRQDTFIGIIDSETWTFFLAPCFGIDQGAVNSGDVQSTLRDIAIGNFPGTTDVKSNSTSARDAAMVVVKKSVLDIAYGAGNVCYAELDPVKGFDGNSHKSLFRWINNSLGTLGVNKVNWNKLLGFAIQKDNDGYYIRFASTLNLYPGQTASDTNTTFAKKPDKVVPKTILGCIPFGSKTISGVNPNREPRDLPKSWSLFVETVLARDLGLALISRENIQSRGENQLSRMTRFTQSGHEGDRIPLEIPMRLV